MQVHFGLKDHLFQMKYSMKLLIMCDFSTNDIIIFLLSYLIDPVCSSFELARIFIAFNILSSNCDQKYRTDYAFHCRSIVLFLFSDVTMLRVSKIMIFCGLFELLMQEMIDLLI